MINQCNWPSDGLQRVVLLFWSQGAEHGTRYQCGSDVCLWLSACQSSCPARRSTRTSWPTIFWTPWPAENIPDRWRERNGWAPALLLLWWCGRRVPSPFELEKQQYVVSLHFAFFGFVSELKVTSFYHQVWVWLAVTSRLENRPLLTSQVGVST